MLSTGGRTVVAICRAAGRPFASLCERVLATLVVTPVKSTPSPLSAAYATGLNTILGSLAASQKSGLARLGAARTAAARSLRTRTGPRRTMTPRSSNAAPRFAACCVR